MKQYNVALQFPDIAVEIHTNDASYYEYLCLYFQPIISQEKITLVISLTVNWESSIYAHIDMDALRANNAICQVGANTFAGDGRIVTIKKIDRRKKTLFDISFKDSLLKVRSTIRSHQMKNFLRYKLFGKSQEDLFFTITYAVLYYPIFWYAEKYLSRYMLHASAVVSNKDGVIVCGLEGIGKTSLALGLLQSSGAQFVSDNLIWYDGANIYPCYELIRIYKDGHNELRDTYFEHVSMFKSQKDYFVPRGIKQIAHVCPKKMILPVFSNRYCVEEISAEEAARRALLLSYIPSELETYAQYRRLYNLIDPQARTCRDQYAALVQLARGMECFSVGMPKRDGLEKNIERVRELINDE